MKKSFVVIILLLLIAILSGVGYIGFYKNKAEAPSRALIGGAFTLEDTEGAIVRDADFRGKLMLVYFGFTYCPDVCPLGLGTLSAALEQLGEQQEEIRTLFITIDPERDTRAQMKSYMEHFNGQIKGLTGTKEQIAEVTAAYRVYFNKAPGAKDGNYLLDHSSFIYLMDRKGQYITHFPSNADPQQIVDAVKKYL